MTIPDADRTGQAAIDYARSRVGGSMAASGYCLQFTRECFAVPAVYGSARDAGLAVNVGHRDRNPAPGTPIWFLTSSVYDHVCFYVGPNEVISTFNADIRSFDGIASIEANFAGTYVGWGEDLNEYRVLDAAVPEPPVPPEDEDDDMPWFIRRNDGLIVIVGPTGVRGVTSEQWSVYTNLGLATFKSGFENMDPGPFDVVVASLGGIVG